MNQIPVVDLQAQYHSLKAEIDDAIAHVLERGNYVLGEEVAAFESEFAAYCGVRHAVGVGSGTDALHLALLACEIGPGDEVITVSHTSVATVTAIESTGARPVLVEIDPRTYTIDPARVQQAITSRTRAILPVHLYGCPADLESLLFIAHQNGLEVIEDCAQAHGALYHQRKVGAWGTVAAFSFYPTKNLGAMGDGGAVLTNDDRLAHRLYMLRQYGWEQRYISQIRGLNSRLDELQAAVLRVKLRHLDRWNAARQRHAALYNQQLPCHALTLPVQPAGCSHVYHQYVVRVETERDVLKTFLQQQGIGCQVHYPVPIHLQPAYQSLGNSTGTLMLSEQIAQQILSLPVYPELGQGAIEQVCQVIKHFFHSR